MINAALCNAIILYILESDGWIWIDGAPLFHISYSERNDELHVYHITITCIMYIYSDIVNSLLLARARTARKEFIHV